MVCQQRTRRVRRGRAARQPSLGRHWPKRRHDPLRGAAGIGGPRVRGSSRCRMADQCAVPRGSRCRHRLHRVAALHLRSGAAAVPRPAGIALPGDDHGGNSGCDGAECGSAAPRHGCGTRGGRRSGTRALRRPGVARNVSAAVRSGRGVLPRGVHGPGEPTLAGAALAAGACTRGAARVAQ